jgi:class 3 adenylate cyclase
MPRRRTALKAELYKLAPNIDLDVAREPQGSRTEGGSTVIEHGLAFMAERAVRAGLDLIQAVGGLKSRAPLQTRVGIATGLVVVGDLIGSDEAQERGIVGETPNLAARLQGVAEPNAVVIAEGTRKLLGSLFELQDLGAKDLKGMAESVRAWAGLGCELGGEPLRGAADGDDTAGRPRRRG